MNLTHGFISVDDHVQEAPDVWTSRLSRARWGDRIPHIEAMSDGIERWMVDGQPLAMEGVVNAGALMADRARPPRRWDEAPRAAYVPKARLAAMDTDGVDYSVLYPTVAGIGGETFGRISDPELELECVRAYNDWLIDEWAASSERFIPQCIVPLFPAEAAAREIERAIGRGHRGVIYPAVPMELRDVPHVNDAAYEPIWSACEALNVPLCIRAGSASSIQAPAPAGLSPAVAAAYRSITGSTSMICVLVNLLVSGILERHPKLNVVFAGSGLGWGAYQFEYTDQQFTANGLLGQGHEHLPSELLRRQCYLTGWYGQAGVEGRRFVGTRNILWAANFPLATSTWPSTHEYINRAFQGVPPEERDQMLQGNAVRLYPIRGSSTTA
ncbi:MAG TPA: amidohydrolase family protein [Chloroflexota bacterium]|nr:amidohydrolase family protein [Chloroflexota bacterium]